MAQTRNQIAKSLGNASNQETLVKRMLNKTVKPVKFIIPAGKTMSEQLDKNGLQTAAYAWLRGCRAFHEVTVSLARDPSARKTKERKLEDFTGSTPQAPIWEASGGNRRFIAERIGSALFEQPNIVAVIVKHDGLYVLDDLAKNLNESSSDWEPYVEFQPKRQEAWRE